MSLAHLRLVCVCLCVHIATVVCQFGFFPQREERRHNGFGQSFFPNTRRITENLATILHFRPGNQDGNQQYIYPFNNIPGISNNRPNYDQYRPEYPNQYQGPNNVRFPDRGRDIPNDNVNFEQPNPYEVVPSMPDQQFNGNTDFSNSGNGNSGFNNDNDGLVSGINNGGPIFSNNDNGGLVSGNSDGRPVFSNENSGLVSGNSDGRPVFSNENSGLVSGNSDGRPVFGNENSGLVSGNNQNGGLISGITDSGVFVSENDKDERPVFGEIEDDGAISSYYDGKEVQPSPVMVVEQSEDANIPAFGDRTGEAEEPPADVPTDSGSPLTPVTEPKNNLNFGGEGVFSETCQTIDGNVGSCITILSCPQYLKLLQQSQTNPEAVRVLRGAHCGFEGNNPKVCCPRQGIPDVPPPSPPPPQPVPTASPKTVGDSATALLDPPVCGVSNASFSRVVGGINASLGDFPWMGLLGYKSKRDGTIRWLCGGSLISSRHVLTAAHCIHNHEDDLYLVRLGELDISRDDDGATPIDVIIQSKIKHEGYDPKAFTNDIGILLLERNVQFTSLIRPICIPKEAELRARNFVDFRPIIAGWGDTQFRGPTASHLQVLQLPVVSNDFCAQAYSQYKSQVIDGRVLCAGYKNGGKDACQGDSGGPLMQPIWNSVTYKTFFYQIGVVSFGKRCAEAGFPGVYTRVTEFVPWIQKNVVGTA